MSAKVRKRGWIVLRSIPYEGLSNDNEPYRVHYTRPAAEREALIYTKDKRYPFIDAEIVEVRA